MENSGASQAERAHWEATPLNYLEKIFQIPFAVRPMPLDGFRTLIDSLTEPQRTSGRLSTQTRQVTATSDVPGPATGSAGSRVNIVSSSGDQVAQPDKPAIADASINVVQERVFDPNPEYLRLSDFEREFMKVLLPLIPSPRAAKRFVNIYRLLRTTVTPNEMLSFVSEDKDGEYRAVQLLLAIQTGYPNQAVEIIRDLIEQNPTVSWWTFVDRYTEKYGQRSKRRSAEPTTRRSIPSHNPIASQVDSERWREFLDRLNLLRPELSERTCTDFIKWSPRIARYSFQSARVLQYATPRSASATQPSPPSGQTVVVVPLPPRSAIWE